MLSLGVHHMARRRLAVVVVLLAVAACLAALTANAAPSQTLAATVVRVVDGDTVVVSLQGQQETVRLIGVDTPETVHPTAGVEPFGPDASAFTKSLLPPGPEVRLEFDVQERDRYGRLLAYVYLPDGRMVNAEILRAGMGQPLTVPPNVKYVDLFVRLQREAREAGRGLWGESSSSEEGVRIDRVDLVGEEVVIVNEGDDAVDLSGWVLVSVSGNQRLTFPPGTVLAPGARLIVRSGPNARPGDGVLVWTRQYIWANQGDPAELRDADGRLVDRKD